MEITKIATIHTGFKSKFGLPRQSGLIDELCGTIEFEAAYRSVDAVSGLDGYSHIWLLWEFSDGFISGSKKCGSNAKFTPTVRPPRLGGNRKAGVFATRSPNRPNRLAMSCVRLLRIDRECSRAPILYVSGIDMTDNTPIYDIKPYLPFTDSHPEALCGFAGEHANDSLGVVFPEELSCLISENDRTAIEKIISEDPRPSYQEDPEREYGFTYAGFDVRFTVKNGVATIHELYTDVST